MPSARARSTPHTCARTSWRRTLRTVAGRTGSARLQTGPIRIREYLPRRRWTFNVVNAGCVEAAVISGGGRTRESAASAAHLRSVRRGANAHDRRRRPRVLMARVTVDMPPPMEVGEHCRAIVANTRFYQDHPTLPMGRRGGVRSTQARRTPALRVRGVSKGSHQRGRGLRAPDAADPLRRSQSHAEAANLLRRVAWALEHTRRPTEACRIEEGTAAIPVSTR